MLTTLPDPIARDAAMQQLAAEIQNRHRSYLRELRIEVVEDGVILRGRTMTFYGKQIAFHEVSCRSRLVVVANEIEVQDRPADESSG